MVVVLLECIFEYELYRLFKCLFEDFFDELIVILLEGLYE